jgi:hypothetical protein
MGCCCRCCCCCFVLFLFVAVLAPRLELWPPLLLLLAALLTAVATAAIATAHAPARALLLQALERRIEAEIQARLSGAPRALTPEERARLVKERSALEGKLRSLDMKAGSREALGPAAAAAERR